MVRRSRIAALFALAVALGSAPFHGQNPVYRAHIKPLKATLTILAFSSIVRMSSGNQDTYLAEVSSGEDGLRGLIKLVDRYRGADDPIRRIWLVQLHPLQMVLVRDEGCDSEANLVHISPAEADIFDPSVRPRFAEQGQEIIPCFLVDHKATRLAK